MVGGICDKGDDRDFPIGKVIVHENTEVVVTHRDFVGLDIENGSSRDSYLGGQWWVC